MAFNNMKLKKINDLSKLFQGHKHESRNQELPKAYNKLKNKEH